MLGTTARTKGNVSFVLVQTKTIAYTRLNVAMCCQIKRRFLSTITAVVGLWTRSGILKQCGFFGKLEKVASGPEFFFFVSNTKLILMEW